MPTNIRIKMCGLKRPVEIEAAVAAKVNYIGFNFFPNSPRYLDFDASGALALTVPEGIAKVALTVDADNEILDALVARVPTDILQLHGAETPERVLEVKARYGLPVMKVIGISNADDLRRLEIFGRVADQLLVDAKPPKNADRPGGNAVTFDWGLIAGRRWPVPWMLAGGLTAANVADAIARTGANQVDLSSGLESAPGVKDPQLMATFAAAARA